MLEFLRNGKLATVAAFIFIAAAGCATKPTTQEPIPKTSIPETTVEPIEPQEKVVYDYGDGKLIDPTDATPVIPNETGQTQGYNYAYNDSIETDILQQFEYVPPPAAVVASDYSSMLGFEENPNHYSGTADTKTIYFGYDLEQIPKAAEATLKAHAELLKNASYARIRIEGHADERGTRDYNVALSERRAKAIKRFLMLNGVSPKQIKVVAYGEEKPAASGSTELAWAKNRRVELVY